MAEVRFVELVDPRGKPQVSQGGISPRLAGLDGKVIGLLNNGKSNFHLFLVDLEELLVGEYPSLEAVQRKKPVVPRPAPKELVQEMADKCDAMVIGLGD
ncbi:MAG: hypothetical protein HYX92_21105 [Chloroflexi bacterium]|nr:hypothetical protein [Chloroflexota bacterium]